MSSPQRNAEKRKEWLLDQERADAEACAWYCERDNRFGDLLRALHTLGIDSDELAEYLEYLKTKP